MAREVLNVAASVILIPFGLFCGQAQGTAAERPPKPLMPLGFYETDQGIADAEFVINGKPFRSTKPSAPVFTLHLGTNGTYEVRCNVPYPTPDIDGMRRHAYQGVQRGTWTWDAEQRTLAFSATNRSHMMRSFPSSLRATRPDFDVLEEQPPATSRPDQPRSSYRFQKRQDGVAHFEK